MRILLLSDQPEDARLGAWKVAFKLREALTALGQDCDLALGGDWGAWPAEAGWRRVLSPWLARRAVERAEDKGKRYDVVDCVGADGCRLTNPQRVVVTRSHGLERWQGAATRPGRRRGSPRLWWEAAGHRRADHVIVPNQRERDWMLQAGWKTEERVSVVYHGVEESWLAAAPERDAKRGAGILFCGTWDTVKGVEILAAAYAQLVGRGVRAPLTVLGPSLTAPAAEAEAYVRGFFPAACQAGLTVLPRADGEEVRRQMQRHDFLVSPSLMEGCSLAQIESLSQRLPLLCTDTGAAAELWGEEGAVMVAAGDAGGLAAAMERMWGDAGLRQRVAEGGWRRAQSLTWRAAAKATVAVYEGALKKRAARRRGPG